MRHVVSQYEIMVVNADGSLVQQLTNNIVYDGEPTWSPDGKQIAFVSNRDGSANIYVMNPDGSSPERVTFDGATSSRIEWSRCTPF